MTRAHSEAPSVHAPDLQAAVAVVRSRGMRLSTSRRLVLETLYAADGPLTAEQIAGGMDLTSVYRNLDALEEIGLVRHAHLGHGPGLYVRTGAAAQEFLLCDVCGTVLAVAPERLDDVRELLLARFGYEARFTHFPIAGLCPGCRAASARQGEQATPREEPR